MIILGIDPGTNRIGHALVEKKKNIIKPISYGCWEFKIRDKGYRLIHIHKNIQKILKEHKPDYLAIESVFFCRNAKTVMQVSEARGVILMTAAKHKVEVVELAPLEIKQKLTGNGWAEKADVQRFVKKILKIKNLPGPDDTADALAIALAGIIKIEKSKTA